MRNYIRYNEHGLLVGCDTRGFGWPDGADPRDPDSADPLAKLLRTKLNAPNSDFVGWVPFDCGCRKQPVSCGCTYEILGTHYYNGVVLFPKPSLAVELDGVGAAIGMTNVNDAQPGNIKSLVLRVAAPDGHEVTIQPVPFGCQLIEEPITARFNSGETPPISISVPQQGMVGTIHGVSKYVRAFSISLRGWA